MCTVHGMLRPCPMCCLLVTLVSKECGDMTFWLGGWHAKFGSIQDFHGAKKIGPWRLSRGTAEYLAILFHNNDKSFGHDVKSLLLCRFDFRIEIVGPRGVATGKCHHLFGTIHIQVAIHTLDRLRVTPSGHGIPHHFTILLEKHWNYQASLLARLDGMVFSSDR
eukprot:scaffold133245_cov50-Attheya_sp.AAC.2